MKTLKTLFVVVIAILTAALNLTRLAFKAALFVLSIIPDSEEDDDGRDHIDELYRYDMPHKYSSLSGK